MKNGVFGVRVNARGKKSGARHCEPRLGSLGILAITTFKTDASSARLGRVARSISISMRIVRVDVPVLECCKLFGLLATMFGPLLELGVGTSISFLKLLVL